MDYLAYKSFIWPVNPETLHMEYRRDPLFAEDPSGQPTYIGMGEKQCIVSGTGEYTGPLAMETFQQMAEVFAESTSGNLILPEGDMIQAYFTRLTMDQDSRPYLIRYSFTFTGTNENGQVPA